MEKLTLEELKGMPLDKAEKLCGEIREYLTENVVITGGHLASNLGITEISVALLRIFSPPEDNIIYDTGHQSYVHKLLTGRKESFSTLRTFGGLSGFTKRSESIYDPFGAGHCSTSISAAIGMARADALAGINGKSIAVIGDGAFSGGLVYEALNNIRKNDKIIIVLNDNEMSISKNVGLMAGYLNKIRATDKYYNIKRKSEEIISSVPIVGGPSARAISKVKNGIKTLVLKNNLFEQLGIYYLGPADGNDLKTTEALLREAKRLNRPVLVHLHTKKGKGFLPAENDPSSYHSVKADPGKKNGTTEQKEEQKLLKPVTFTENFGKIVTAAASENEKITAVTAAMCDGVGLNLFEKKFPHRFFDVGIAEEHGMTFTAGMAAGGALPVFALYSTFFQRAYDQVFHDLALQKLKAVIALDRSGLVGEDGPTHHGLFDVAISLPIPDVSIYSPATLSDQVYVFKEALICKKEEKESDVCIIRYPKGTQDSDTAEIFDISKDISVYSPYPYDEIEAVIVTYGRITAEALKAVKMCRVKCAVVKVLKLKPFDTVKFYEILEGFSKLKAVKLGDN